MPKKPKRGGKMSIKTQRMLRMHVQRSDEEIRQHTYGELLTELQIKYSGLYSLNRTMGNSLILEISKVIANRLKLVVEGNPDRLQSCFNLSSAYRKKHPHFTDFELILSTLHKLEDNAGAPRTQLCQDTMSKAPGEVLMLGDIPYYKVDSVCKSYSDKVNKKLKDHISSLSTDLEGTGDAREKASIRIRAELKKTLPYIDSIVRQVFNWEFLPSAPKVPVHHKMRIYGEPSLPSKESLRGFFRKCHASKIRRSDGIYNMVYFIIPRQMYAACIKLDGTTIENCKLVVRSSDTPTYKDCAKF